MNGVEVDVYGLAEATGELRLIRSRLADRGQLNAAIAGDAENFTRDYLLKTPRHERANKIGATPTNHRAKIARQIESGSDNDKAFLRFPRVSGLGRAFHDVTIRPGPGKKFLTIPAGAETYGRRVGEFPEGTFKFVTLHAHRLFLVLVWAESGGKHQKGDIAWWLRRSVFQEQDRTLLPSDAAYIELGRRRSVVFIASLRYQAA